MLFVVFYPIMNGVFSLPDLGIYGWSPREWMLIISNDMWLFKLFICSYHVYFTSKMKWDSNCILNVLVGTSVFTEDYFFLCRVHTRRRDRYLPKSCYGGINTENFMWINGEGIPIFLNSSTRRVLYLERESKSYLCGSDWIIIKLNKGYANDAATGTITLNY